jgi:hypothetical protein
MNATTASSEELRLLVRRVLLEMLDQDRTGNDTASEVPVEPSHRWRSAQPEREIHLTVRGSERSIGLLEEALRSGDTTLEISIGPTWGPRVRVRADRSED